MRKLGLTLLAGAMVCFPGAAFSQQSQTPTADDYVCQFSGDCGQQQDQNAEQQADQPSGHPRITATRGFSLARPTSVTSTTSTTARQAPRANQRQVASRQTARRPAAPQGRVDLRLAFGNGSSTLSSQAQAQLQAFAEALQRPQLSSMRFRIEGHTDSSGSRATNVALSQRRAQAVVDYLVSHGVPQSRLEVRGYGPDRPLPGKPASAPDNRRVEAVRIS